MLAERSALLSDGCLRGASWCRAHAALVDAWLADLLHQATGGDDKGLALVALGGYGRAELAPGSDIDVMLLHEGRSDVASVAERLWYPIWESRLALGHSVSTVKQALRLAAGDLDTATALLSTRLVVGDRRMAECLASEARESWQRRSKRWLTELAGRVEHRHRQAGEVAFRLEPDLKEGRGGLRDVHALRWAEAAHRVLFEIDDAALARWESVLLDARVELQRQTGRAGNVLALQEQPGVARALGDADADALMARIAEAARSIAWTSDDGWRRIADSLRHPLARRINLRREVAPGVCLSGGEVSLIPGASERLPEDPLLALRVAAAAAAHGAAIERSLLERLAASPVPMAQPWPDEARSLFVDLLRAGTGAISVIEALDQRGLWGRLLPEWIPVRALPPHNAYHRFTVDRHLLETVANAAQLADRVTRPDLLVAAALLHDLGKGGPGDHSASGAILARTIATRMGFAGADVETLSLLVDLHLLLPNVATRRDLDDPATIRRVAEAVGCVERLRLLAALCEADSQATGASAWGPWKAELVGRLVERVTEYLDNGESLAPELFPSAAQLARLSAGGRHVQANGMVLTVMDDDRPGMFSRVAGVLAMHGLDVLAAVAYSSEDGRALSEFRVVDHLRGDPPWPRVLADIHLALDGRLAIGARVAARARTYARGGPTSRKPAVPSVSFDNQASENATVIDVRAPDVIGTLYRITATLAEFDLDIRSAKVQTLGSEVVDAFYVRDRSGAVITEQDRLAEIQRAILHVLEEPP